MPKDVAEATDLTRSNVRKLIKALADAGEIGRDAAGRYFVGTAPRAQQEMAGV